MNLRQLWSKNRARWMVCAAIVLTVLGFGVCVLLRISRPADIQAYYGMASECHPIWKQFALRRFNVGDSSVELLRRYPPDYKEEFGRYGVYSYYQNPEGIHFTGLQVVTRDGRLLSAATGSCTWEFTFFRVEDSDLYSEYAVYSKAKQDSRERERLDKLESEKGRPTNRVSE